MKKKNSRGEILQQKRLENQRVEGLKAKRAWCYKILQKN